MLDLPERPAKLQQAPSRQLPLQPPMLVRDINNTKWLYSYQTLLDNPNLHETVVGEHFMTSWKWVLVRKRAEDIDLEILATGQGWYNQIPAYDGEYNFVKQYIHNGQIIQQLILMVSPPSNPDQ